jgi:hypothetical protein
MASSPNDTIDFAGSGAAITDASGNLWTITAGGQVAVNAMSDPLTGNVLELAYVDGVVWQKNAQDLWWSKTSPSSAWLPPYGTAIPPLPVTASPNDTVVYSPPGVATAAITDASGNTWAINATGQVTVNGTVDNTTGNVVELAYANGQIWQENTAGLWWSKSAPTDAWGPTYGTSANPIQGVNLNLDPDFSPGAPFPRPVSVGNLSATGSGRNTSSTLAIPVGGELITTGVRLSNYSLTISYGPEAQPTVINATARSITQLWKRYPPLRILWAAGLSSTTGP